jgi:hypothetical protein
MMGVVAEAVVILLVIAAVLAAGLALAVRGQRRGTTRPNPVGIDPFAIGDPWRRLVQRALHAQNRYRAAVDAARPGPTRDRLVAIGAGVDDAVLECWRIARRGHELTRTLNGFDVTARRAQLAAAPPDDDSGGTGSLRAQLESYDSIAATSARTERDLRLLVGRLDEAAARGAELTVVSGQDDALDALGTDVSGVVDELDSLRLALEELGRGR